MLPAAGDSKNAVPSTTAAAPATTSSAAEPSPAASVQGEGTTDDGVPLPPPRSPSTAPRHDFDVGMPVKLHSLKSDEYNGCLGEVINAANEAGRFGVQLDAPRGSKLLLKGDNLRALDEAAMVARLETLAAQHKGAASVDPDLLSHISRLHGAGTDANALREQLPPRAVVLELMMHEREPCTLPARTELPIHYFSAPGTTVSELAAQLASDLRMKASSTFLYRLHAADNRPEPSPEPSFQAASPARALAGELTLGKLDKELKDMDGFTRLRISTVGPVEPTASATASVEPSGPAAAQPTGTADVTRKQGSEI